MPLNINKIPDDQNIDVKKMNQIIDDTLNIFQSIHTKIDYLNQDPSIHIFIESTIAPINSAIINHDVYLIVSTYQNFNTKQNMVSIHIIPKPLTKKQLDTLSDQTLVIKATLTRDMIADKLTNSNFTYEFFNDLRSNNFKILEASIAEVRNIQNDLLNNQALIQESRTSPKIDKELILLPIAHTIASKSERKHDVATICKLLYFYLNKPTNFEVIHEPHS